MKNNRFNILFISVCLGFSSGVIADNSVAPSNGPYSHELTSGRSMTVQSVSDKFITIGGNTYSIGAITKIVTRNGSNLKVSDLRKGMIVNIEFDDQQRYLSKPTLSRIILN